MWMITNRGFYSAVQDKKDPNVIVIRARTDRHLDALMDLLPKGTKISKNEGRSTDYPCRVRVSAAEWIRIAGVLASEVDYTNFKDSVERGKRGKALTHAKYDHSVYMSVWGVLRRLTSTREMREQDTQRSKRHGSGGRRGSRRGRRDPEQLFDTPVGSPRSADMSMAFDPWPTDDPLRPGGPIDGDDLNDELADWIKGR